MASETEDRDPAQAGEPDVERFERGGTYRTLDEQEGRLSAAEERFERRRRTVGLFLGPLVLLAMLAIPFDLDGNQHRLLAILAFTVVWWVTEAIPIPITALVAVALCVLLEATPPPEEGDSAADVVFSLFADDTVFLFIGSFILAEAMVVHGLHRRLAYRVLSMKAVGGSTFRIILAFGLIGALTSPVMSNTAGAAMMLPLAFGVMGIVGSMLARQHDGGGVRPERLRFGSALMLVITYGITVGGLLLPIGSPPNLIGRELLEQETGEPITFLEWFVTALPIVVVMFVAVVAIVLLLNRPETDHVEGVEEYVAAERAQARVALARGEERALGARLRAAGLVPAGDRRASSPVTTRTPTCRSARRPTRARSACSPRRCCSCCRSTGPSASSRSTGTRRRGSTGARSCCSAAASCSARC